MKVPPYTRVIRDVIHERTPECNATITHPSTVSVLIARTELVILLQYARGFKGGGSREEREERKVVLRGIRSVIILSLAFACPRVVFGK